MDKERIEIIKKLRAFLKKQDIEKAILFGSYARGEAKEDSDIDLILVSEEFEGKSQLKRPVQFYLEWDLGYPVDFLCYTPKEFNDLRKQVSIVSQALKEGIEIAG
ncbi:MAG: nucleotidyltransferase domain-containing protein [Euryarchaeota archaeon]|nr:nucleotidyltransferase domain-containing protein [Euryarchaeota archaeon]